MFMHLLDREVIPLNLTEINIKIVGTQGCANDKYLDKRKSKMAHYAEIDTNVTPNQVIRVIVVNDSDEPTEAAGEAFCTSLLGGTWKKTSYNTRGNVHYGANSNTSDGEPALRANYAGAGYIYDNVNDVFYPPSPYPSWTISAETNWMWAPPTPMPGPTDGKFYIWDEPTLSWIEHSLSS
jgi:hypothetical protein